MAPDEAPPASTPAPAAVEGLTRLCAAATGPAVGPGTRVADAPFLNPAMRVNRDLSVLTVAAYAAARGRGIDVADVLAGSGARSLRIANECSTDQDITVHANDGSPDAVAAIEAGAIANGVADRVRATHQSAHAFLAAGRFDVIDIDPFGSPSPFLDAAVQAIRHGGVLMATATDTGALAGKYPRVCHRRYAAAPAQDQSWNRDAGLRILLAAVARAAGRFDRGIEPLWCIGQDHWMRACVRVVDGRGKADATWHHIGHLDAPDGWPAFGRDGPGAGPLWTAPLHDRAFVAAMQRVAAPGVDAATHTLLARVAAEESGTPPLDMGWLQARFGHTAPRRDALLAALHDAGHAASRCHLSPTAIRTPAPPDVVAAAWRAAGGGQ